MSLIGVIICAVVSQIFKPNPNHILVRCQKNMLNLSNVIIDSLLKLLVACYHSTFCLSNMSAQRPTAKELLKHKFITRYTKKTAYLTELIDRYRRWKSEGHGEESSSDDSDM